MKITFLGAARTVTGSCFLVETNDTSFLVDCGMFQGGGSAADELNAEPFPFPVDRLDFVILTHTHIDHSGRIPKLYKEGYRGKVICTKATYDLCAIMLPDSGYIQEMEYEWKNRKKMRAGESAQEPIYTFQDAVESLALFESHPYDEPFQVNNYVRVLFRDAGHVLGSSIVEMWIAEGGRETKIVFSGDIGTKNKPLIRDPEMVESADYVIMESTYGNRLRAPVDSDLDRFLDIINDTIGRGGNVIIPSFAVGRTQEVIYELNKHFDVYADKARLLFKVPVYVDSPMATYAIEVYRKNLDCFDEEARSFIEMGDNPLDFPELHFTRSAEESKALNTRSGSAIILSASGMCEAGRIKHHLKHNLWRPECTILFVGYQAEGTLGRKILDGAKKVKIFGEEISVNARIEKLDGLSGHADQSGLLEWVGGFRQKPRKIFVVHGEEDSSRELAGKIENLFGIPTEVPDRGDSYLLTENELLYSYLQIPAHKRFIRLELLDQLDAVNEEIQDLSEELKDKLKQETDDEKVEKVIEKLKALEKYIMDIRKTGVIK